MFTDGNEVTKECVIEYKHHLLTCGYAERSVNSMLAALNSFFTYMKWFEFRVKPLRISPEIYIPEQKELTENEYFRLVKTARNVSEKLSLIIQTLCSTGMRISELQFITVEALKNDVIVRCKGKTRKVFVVSGLRKMLLLYAKKARDTTRRHLHRENGKTDRTNYRMAVNEKYLRGCRSISDKSLSA